MGLEPGQAMADLKVNTVFIGSCTNARIEDLREAARMAKGRSVATGVRALVVPGSASVREQAEQEGLDEVFKAAGFEWHRAGCSMCLGMNGDIVRPGEHSASTSNRPYEGRQGPGYAPQDEGNRTDQHGIDEQGLRDQRPQQPPPAGRFEHAGDDPVRIARQLDARHHFVFGRWPIMQEGRAHRLPQPVHGNSVRGNPALDDNQVACLDFLQPEDLAQLGLCC